MAIITVGSTRARTECKTIREATFTDLDAAYNAYEVAQAAIDTETRQTRIVACFNDGAEYCLVAETSWIEKNSDPTGQVPLLP